MKEWTGEVTEHWTPPIDVQQGLKPLLHLVWPNAQAKKPKPKPKPKLKPRDWGNVTNCTLGGWGWMWGDMWGWDALLKSHFHLHIQETPRLAWHSTLDGFGPVSSLPWTRRPTETPSNHHFDPSLITSTFMGWKMPESKNTKLLIDFSWSLWAQSPSEIGLAVSINHWQVAAAYQL